MKIVFQPASQIGNAGDQLINLATLDRVRGFGELVINDLNTPEWFLEGIGARSERRFSEFRRPRFYTGFMRVLIGERMRRSGERYVFVLPPGHSSRRGMKEAVTALVWYVKLGIFRMLGCPVVRAGFSIGPFDRLNAAVESFGSRCFSVYGLRDRESMALARRHRFANVSYFPDLAWSYRPRIDWRAPDPDAPIVVSFRSNAYGIEHDSAYLSPIRERLARLLERQGGRRRVVVCHQVESDAAASRELLEGLTAAGAKVELIERKLSIDEAAAIYANACCVISNRLHVLLLAARSGTLPVPLAKADDNVKITSILRDNGLSELVLDLESGLDENANALDRLLRNRGGYLERLHQVGSANSKLIEAEFERVFRSFGAR